MRGGGEERERTVAGPCFIDIFIVLEIGDYLFEQ